MQKISDYKVVVVGSGLFGLTVARKIVEEYSLPVVVIEKRKHIGGNSYSYDDPETGIEIHKYGSHLFHTSNEGVWKYVNRFSEFSDYRHTVWTKHNGIAYSMPVNLSTIQQFYSKYYSPAEASELIKSLGNDKNPENENFEERAIRLIGRPMYEAFIKNYTFKQWQTDPKLLPAEIISRLPVRTNFNNRYFNDIYEGLPVDGYGKLVSRMADHPHIELMLETDFFKVKDSINPGALIIYTGPIDQFFNFNLGKLSWRTLDFEIETLDIPDFQGTSVMNYADLDVDYTRIHEFKHFSSKKHESLSKTVIMREYSRFAGDGDEPYYPVNSSSDRSKLLGYRDLAKLEKQVIFGGRLGSYQYLDMHMAIASAFSIFDREVVDRMKELKIV